MKGQNFLRACSIVLVLVGVFMLAAGGYGVMNKVMDAKEVKLAERADALSSIQLLDDGINTLALNRQAYEDGKVAYEEGTEQYAEGQATLTSGQAEYDEGEATLAAGKETYNEKLAEYNAGVEEYSEGLELYNEKYQEYLEGVATYEAGVEAYNEGKATLEAATAEYNLGKALLGSETIQNFLALAAEGGLIPDSIQEKIDEAYAGIAEYEAGEEQLAEAETQLADGKAQLADAEEQLADAKAQLTDAEAQLTSGKAQLADVQQQLADGESQLSSVAVQLSDGYEQLDDAAEQLADGKAQLDTFEDGEAQVADGISQLEENDRIKELVDDGTDPIVAGHQAVDEATEETTNDLTARTLCYMLAILGGLLAIITGIIGTRAAGMPSVGKIKASIIMGSLTMLIAIAANIYSAYIVNEYTIDIVTYSQYNTTLQVAAIALLGIGSILFVVSIFRFKNALVALLTAD